ncbi:MAG: FAD-binding protein [Flavobacteriales bacterium]|nr:FAD-binding protein [Flavobacteriales bacterium]
MIKRVEIKISPKLVLSKDEIKNKISNTFNIKKSRINHIEIIKKSIDARSKNIKYNLIIDIYIDEKFIEKTKIIRYKNVQNSKKVFIIGAGPAGLFAALKLIERGIKPIIFERGKKIRDRRRDIAQLTNNHIVNVDSNYCFGEGGAGTFSDGKLYTRSKKKGDIMNILDILIQHGADRNIKIDAHPHIGTNKLPKIITSIRDTIINFGGEINFNSKLTNIKITNNKIHSIEINKNKIIKVSKLILATGHSARDIFKLLHKKEIKIEAKEFALGVRIEHKQKLIDQIQYKCKERSEYLPPSQYSIKKQINGRGIFSFCMCPGGIIAPCATEEGQVVTNGWSPSKRDYPSSNSGIVVEIKTEDLKKFKKYGPLAGVYFQEEIERKACILAGGSQKVPAQRLLDFIDNKLSENIPLTSYIPGTTSVKITELFPAFINNTLKNGFIKFGKKMKGYLTNDAIIHAPETRTSSPVRIPRNKNTLEHEEISGIYPCGEGAGYAGGIVSAAIDGERCANKC